MLQRFQYQTDDDLQSILAAHSGMKVIMSEVLTDGNFVTLDDGQNADAPVQIKQGDLATLQSGIATLQGNLLTIETAVNAALGV